MLIDDSPVLGREFDSLLDCYRPLFAHATARKERTLLPGSDGITMTVLIGKFGTIRPWSMDGRVLQVDYTAEPPLSSVRLNRLEAALMPFSIAFRKLDGEYAARFGIEHLEAVAEIIQVRRRRRPRGIALQALKRASKGEETVLINSTRYPTISPGNFPQKNAFRGYEALHDPIDL